MTQEIFLKGMPRTVADRRRSARHESRQTKAAVPPEKKRTVLGTAESVMPQRDRIDDEGDVIDIDL